MKSLSQAVSAATNRRRLTTVAAAFAMLCATVPCVSAKAQDRSATSSGAKEAHAYRLTYTVTESDAGKRVSVQHYAMAVMANGQRASMKQGSKNPVMTGGYLHEGEPGTTQFQFTYLDTGLNLSARLTEDAAGMELDAKVELSSIVDAVNPQMLKDPAVRQTVIENSTTIRLGTPVLIGSMDVPGSTRHIDVEASLEHL